MGIVAVPAGEHYTIGFRSDGIVVVAGADNNSPENTDVSEWKDVMLP